MTSRIIGYDIARAFAIFGMVLVNFKLVMGADNGSSVLINFAHIFEGRAAGLFVVLAGIGLSLMTQKARLSGNTQALIKARNNILKRGSALVVIGTLFLTIWPADILHFYGLYFFFAAFMFNASSRRLLVLAIFLMAGFVLYLVLGNYEAGWNWETLDYSGLWTVTGYLRHWFFNGFHPVFPWGAFLLIGLWLGRLPMQDKYFRRILALKALVIVIITQLASFSLIAVVDQRLGASISYDNLVTLLSTNVIPPMPQYIISAAASAIVIIVTCIEIAERFESAAVVRALAETGRQSLSVYIAHVLLGMGVIEVSGFMGTANIETAFVASLIFCIASVVGTNLWRLRWQVGLCEYLFRRVTR